MKCPGCGSKMLRLRDAGRYECRNRKCHVIEVRVSKDKGKQVLCDTIMASRKALRRLRPKPRTT